MEEVFWPWEKLDGGGKESQISPSEKIEKFFSVKNHEGIRPLKYKKFLITIYDIV